MYPSLAIAMGIYPAHLGPTFLEIYGNRIVKVRLAEKKKPKKDRDFVIVEGFKLAANGTYGKTKEATSWLFDALYPLQTVVAGQLLLTMWAESLVEASPDLTFIQFNTDGITIKCKKEDEQKILDASTKLMEHVGLTYEANNYKRMVIRDVNNYSAQYMSGDIKHKGDFEIDKALHKDPSMKIVPYALEQYFFKGIPVEQTIRNHTNIYDFCLRLKTNKTCTPVYTYLDDGVIKHKNLQRTNRYFISNTVGVLHKDFHDGRKIGVNIGFNVTLFNNYVKKEMEDYNINYDFYISECYKIIHLIEESSRQLRLF